MIAETPANHPLRKLLEALVSNTFHEIHDRDIEKFNDMTKYVSDLLVDFCHMERIEKIKNLQGAPVKTVKDLLYEAECLDVAFNFEHEQKIHKHIGDYTLFMLGLFPEYMKHLKTNNLIHHPDHYIDHVKCGKRSYSLVVEFCNATGDRQAPLFTNLMHHFEANVQCLNVAKKRLDEMAEDTFLSTRELIIK